MSLRLRLISLVGLVLLLALGLGGAVSCLTASRSVSTEMNAALAVARQTVASGVAGLSASADPARDLEHLVASFRGNRHLRVFVTGEGAAAAAPALERAALGEVPLWFERLVGVPPRAERIPLALSGAGDRAVVIETDPHNEILEVWNAAGDSFIVLAAAAGTTALLIYLLVGQALRPLDRLVSGLAAVGRGDYAVRLDQRLPRELAPLRDGFNAMAGELAQVAEENRRLTAKLLTLQEEERSELAHDLHDEIGPLLFAIGIDAASVTRHLETDRPAAAAASVQSIAEAVALMRAHVKSMLGRLKPLGLAEFGLAEAIGHLLGFWQRRHPDVEFRPDITAARAGFGELLDLTIYRIVQEAISNALRHSRPAIISLSIRQAHDESIVVEIADDGQGMAPDAASGGGYGLRGMSERVKALGGTLSIANTAGRGLTVVAQFPASAARHPGAAEPAITA